MKLRVTAKAQLAQDSMLIPTPGRSRDSRLDVMRGLGMIIIAINHVTALFMLLGYRGRTIPSLADFGQSSAAELFVSLSGYMVGLVYLRGANLSARIWARARHLYLINLIAAITCGFIIALADARLAEATQFSRYLGDWADFRFLKFIFMLDLPIFLNILPLYVVLMLGVPLAARLWRASTTGFWLTTLAIYGAAQIWEQASPATSATALLGWGLNPLAWQLLFYGMMALGASSVHSQLFQWLSGSTRRPLFFMFIFVLAAVLDRAWAGGLMQLPRMDGKANLECMRLLHAIVTLLAITSVIALSSRYLASAAMTLVARVGRETLICYAVSIPLTYAVGAIWLSVGRPYWAYPVAALAVLLLVVMVALRPVSARPAPRSAKAL